MPKIIPLIRASDDIKSKTKDLFFVGGGGVPEKSKSCHAFGLNKKKLILLTWIKYDYYFEDIIIHILKI